MSRGRISMRRKMTVVLIGMLLVFVAIIGKLAYIQLVQGSELQLKAEENRTRERAVAAARGTIYDRNGNKLAISVTADSVTASPPDVVASEQQQETAAFLARVLEMDEATVLERITSDASFVWVKRKIDFDVAEMIKEANLPGINIEGETRRYYPKGTLASHILGYAGVDNQGLEGLELMLDEELSGTAGRMVAEYDANGHLLPQSRREYITPEDGYDVYLTLDENIQYFAERELDNLMASEVAPQRAGIIVMRPQTGEILALAARPTYDPNNFADAAEGSQRNIMVTDQYEPGSTFKIITAAAALEEGTATLESRYYDSGYAMVAGTRINCWRGTPHGSQNFTEALQHSCNPALIQIGQGLESKEDGLFYKYIRAFGFGSATGVQMSGESAGQLIAEDRLGPVELATTCIGQGIAVTPMQMVAAVSAVANGGTLLQPQIVYEIRDGDEVVQEFEPKVVRQVISAETAETLRYVLEQVVAGKEGTGKKAYIEGYRVGGKTGTAQKPNVGVGGYADGKYVASFIGMAPVNDPQIVCLVFVDEPVVGHHQGSLAAAPVFKAVVEDTMRYLGVVPQITGNSPDEIQTGTVSVPDLQGLSGAAAAQVLSLSELSIELRGDSGTVVEQMPAAYAEVKSGTVVIVTLGEEGGTQVSVPDLTGKRLSTAAEMLSALGLTLSAEGSEGMAYEQDPVPGTQVSPGSTVRVKFGAPLAGDSDLAD